MNKYFTNPIFNMHNCLLTGKVPEGYAQNAYLRKKISDYYFSRLIPDFFYESKLPWKYSPYVVTSRLMFTFIGGYLLYRFYFIRPLKKETHFEKKYNFNIFTKGYLRYEEALIKSEKQKKSIII